MTKVAKIDSIDSALSFLAQLPKPMFFLQIGANDGVTDDPIRKYVLDNHWAGILIEPVPYVFKRLQNNYQDESKLRFENIAVSTSNKPQLFWYPKPNDLLPVKYDQVGSFFKEHLLKHEQRFPGISEFITCKSVKCLTVQEVLQKHAISEVDIILIDAEGADEQIVCSLPLHEYDPSLIVFENIHMNNEKHESCKNFLANKGYDIFEDDADTIAFK